MLGGSCSPCCGCTRSQTEPIYDQLRARSFSLSIAGFFPVTSAYSIMDRVNHWLPGAEPASATFTGARQSDQVIGSHSLALSLSGADTFIQANGFWQATFRKITTSLVVSVRVQMGAGTVNEAAGAYRFFDGSQCVMNIAVSVESLRVVEAATWSTVKPALSIQNAQATDNISLDSVTGCAANSYTWNVQYFSPDVLRVTRSSNNTPNVEYLRRNNCASSQPVGSILFVNKNSFTPQWFSQIIPYWTSSLSDLTGVDCRTGQIVSSGNLRGSIFGAPLQMRPPGSFWADSDGVLFSGITNNSTPSAQNGSPLTWVPNTQGTLLALAGVTVTATRTPTHPNITSSPPGLAYFVAEGSSPPVVPNTSAPSVSSVALSIS